MKRSKQTMKRALASLMSLLMVVTMFGTLPVFATTTDPSHTHGVEPQDDSAWTGTTGELVAKNYDELTDAEKAILSSAALKGDAYVVEVPTDKTVGLVSVDADAKSVTAYAYQVNGFVWKPTAAVLKYTDAAGNPGVDLEVKLNQNGDKYVGFFQNPTNSYTVAITYSLYIPVDADLQKQLLNTPYYLVDGYLKMDDATILAPLVAQINGRMKDLEMLSKGFTVTKTYEGKELFSYTLKLANDSEVKKAIDNLVADYNKPENQFVNGEGVTSGRLSLTKDFKDYADAANKIRFILENGATVKAHIDWFYTQLYTINKNSKELKDLANELDALASREEGTPLADAQAKAEEKIQKALADAEAEMQTMIADEVDKVNAQYPALKNLGLDISSLKGKSRDALIAEIDALIVKFGAKADELDAQAAQLEAEADQAESIFGSAFAQNIRNKAKEARDGADLIRNTGIAKLNELKTAAQDAYELADNTAAEARELLESELTKAAAEAKKAAADIRDIVDGTTSGVSLRQLVKGLSDYADLETAQNKINAWEFIGKDLLKDSVTDKEYDELNELVIDASYEEPQKHDDIEIKPELLATSTVIEARVDQYVVTVDVKAQVVSKNAQNNSADTVALTTVSEYFPMDKGTTAAQILSAIASRDTEAKALAQWDSYYNVGETYYDRTVTITDGEGNPIDELTTLTEDIRYTITYTPKNFVITEDYKEGEYKTTVPYGYKWLLPRPADLSQSYDYEINGVPHRENTVYTVTGNITVTRKAGKAIEKKSLAALIAESYVPGSQLSAKERNILNSGAFNVTDVFYRTPATADMLSKVGKNGGGYKLVAEAMNAGLSDADAAWIPVAAYPVFADGVQSEESLTLTETSAGVYEATFDLNASFTSVTVVYQLEVTGLDLETVSGLVNIGHTLVADTADQKAMLDSLCGTIYERLASITKTTFAGIEKLVSLDTDGKNALNAIIQGGINNDTGYTYLYEHLARYNGDVQGVEGGLAYYYKGNNAAEIQKQIDLIKTNLPTVWNDPAMKAYVNSDPMFAGQSDKIESVMDKLDTVTLKQVNPLVNTNSGFIADLLKAVAAEGTVSEHTVTGHVVMQTELSAAAPDQTQFGVEIQVLDKNNGLVKAYTSYAFRPQGDVVTVAEWRAMYEALLATIPNHAYYVADVKLPTQNVELGDKTEVFTSALRPMTYTVKIDGEADVLLYVGDAYVITLPGTGNTGYKYLYNVGGKDVEVMSGALENYSLGTTLAELDMLFGSDRELVITRKLVDINRANLIEFVNKMNQAFANSGFTFVDKNGQKQMAVAFIPMEDKDGNMTVVLRLTTQYQNIQPGSLAAEMGALILNLSYVGINNNPLFGIDSNNELKLYLQTVINLIVNSGLGMSTMSNIIDKNGNIKEFDVPGATAIGAVNNSVAVGNGAVIGSVDDLGGKLMQATMQFGVSANNATSVPFYVTYQDFDTEASRLQKIKKGIDQITPYFDLVCKDGALNIKATAPDSAYAYMMAALLMVGQVDFATIQSYDLDAVLNYCIDLIRPMFDTDGIDAMTFINTMKQTGFYDAIPGFDMEAHTELMNFMYNTIDHIYDHTASEGDSNGNIYTGSFTYDALDMLLNQKVSLGDYTSMIAELNTGLTLPITFTSGNRGAEYEALVLDIRADGILNKYYMSRDIVADMSKLSDSAVVVLLSGVRGNIVVKNDVILNLNGHTVDGNITAKGTLAIVDSTLDTKKCGGVIGKLIADGGTFKLGAGKYTTDVSAYLNAGYVLDKGVVTNGCFSLEKNGDNLNIYLDEDYLLLDKSAAKVMATDLIAKLLMNYYACSQMTVDGNTLYGIDLVNITESLDDLTVLIGKMVECFNCDGVSAFATQFMADMTDFGALADAIENNAPVVSYTLQNAAFNPYMDLVGTEYFTFNIAPTAAVKTTNINVLLSKNISLEHKEKAVALLRELDNITTIQALAINIQDITYGNTGLSGSGNAQADVVLDLSTNVNYPVIMAAILANSVTGSYKTELVNAIKDYQTSYSVTGLKKALDKMTVAQLINALKVTKGKSMASLLKSLGVTAPDAIELESLYTVARKAIGTVAELSGVNGGNQTLGGLKDSTLYGTYSYSISRGANSYASLKVCLFAEEKAILVKDANGIVCMHSDNLVEVLTSVRKGYTVYVNKPVVLEKDLALPGVAFTLAKAENIDFAGNYLWFTDGNTVLTVDRDIADNITYNKELACKPISHTEKDGWHIFRLEGELHEWEDIAPIEPDCENEGWTAGVWCKHCHKYQDGKEPQRIDPKGHSYSTKVVDPTCTEDGYTVYTCDNCGDSYEDDFVPATKHAGTTVILPYKAPTCTEDGLTEGQYCTACQTITIAQIKIPAGHKPVDYQKAPTCTDKGIADATVCEVCGETIEAGTEIPALGHKIAVEAGKQPTCTDTGLTAGAYCPVCDHVHVEQEVIPALGHDIVIDPGKDATCTESGLTEGSHCTRCDAMTVEQTVIEILDHTVVVDPAVPATKDSTGLTEGSHCDVCKRVLVEQKELAKLPFINVPTVTVEKDGGLIRGAKVDADNRYIYLDVSPNGLKVKDFGKVSFVIENATRDTLELTDFSGMELRDSDDLVRTGDVVTVWATNKDGAECEVKYRVIILGDVNCDGKANSRDLVRMSSYYMDELEIEGASLLAADVNFDGKVNSRDMVNISTKYMIWDENGYESKL